MKTQIIMILILFFISTGKAFAIDITLDNYRDFIGKHFIVLPNEEIAYSVILNKQFDYKKYKNTPLLIKEIKTNSDGFSEIIVEEKSDTKEPADITIKISPEKKSLWIYGFAIKEDLEEAKSFFIGKTLFAAVSSAEIYSLPYNFKTKAQKNTPYIINDVVFDDSGLFFRLMLDEKQYIRAYNKEETLVFTFFNPAKAYPEKYNVHRREDKLERIRYFYIENKLNLSGKDTISFDVWQHIKGSIKSAPSISLRYSSTDWLFVNGATLYIDGRKTSLSLGNRDSDVYEGTEGNIIHENFYFEITKKQIQDIAKGKSVTLRLLGDKGYVDGEFTKQNLYDIKRFYDEEIK